MMRPPRGLWSRMIFMASCEHRNGAVRLVATTACHLSNGSSSSGTGGAPMPALLNRTSKRPNVSLIVANSALICAGSDTSVGTTRLLAGAPSLATASSGSLRRPASTTVKPSFIRARDAARPTPVPAPVTTATFKEPAINSLPFQKGLFRGRAS
jgi:hypothetical protein